MSDITLFLEREASQSMASAAVFWRKVILVPKVILRYGGLKVFFSLDPKKGPKEGLQVATAEILKWKKYIKQSKDTNGSPLEPLYGSKKKKVSTIMTFRPINLPFCSEEKSYWCRFDKKEKSHHGASTLVWEKSHNGALNCNKMTFLQNKMANLLVETSLWC